MNAYKGRYRFKTHLFSIFCATLFLASCGGGSGSGDGDGDGDVTPEDNLVINTLPNNIVLEDTGISKFDATSFLSADISPDGKHLYASARNGKLQSNRLVVFQFDNVQNTFVNTSFHLDINPSIVIISPDGGYVYIYDYNANGGAERVLFTYKRNSIDGTLTKVGSIDLNSISSLHDVSFVLSNIFISPDGKHLYSASSNGPHIARFAIEQTSGLVTFLDVQIVSNASNAITTNAIISNDGKYLYLVKNDYLFVLEHDPITGILSLIQEFGKVYQATGEFVDTDNITDIKISVDQKLIYIAGDTALRDINNNVNSKRGFLVLNRDENTGLVSYMSTYESSEVVAVERPGKLLVSRDDENLYITVKEKINDFNNIKILVFTRDLSSDSFALSQTYDINNVNILVEHETFLLSHPSDSYIYSFHAYNGGQIAQYQRDSVTGHINNGPVLIADEDETEGLRVANAMSISPDDNNLYVLGGDITTQNDDDPGLVVYSADQTTGELTRIQLINFENELPGGDRSITVSPDGLHAYLSGSRRILGFTRDLTSGVLTRLPIPGAGLYEDLPNVIPSTERMCISHDGLNIYVPVFVSDGVSTTAGLAALNRDPSTGELNLLEVIDFGVGGSRFTIGISADDKHIYFVNRSTASLFVLNRSTINGTLTLEDVMVDELTDGSGVTIDGLDEASSIGFSPDGKHVYITSDEIYWAINPYTGLNTNIVTMNVFLRDGNNGRLTVVQTLKRGGEDSAGNKIDERGGSHSVVVHPSGEEVYMITRDTRSAYQHIAKSGYSIDVFKRDVVSGELEFMQRVNQGLYGNGISKILSSGNGDYIYSTNRTVNSLAVLRHIGLQ